MPTPRRGNTISPISATGSFINKIVYDREERSLLAIEQGNLHNNILSTRTRRCLSNGLLISRFAKPI